MLAVSKPPPTGHEPSQKPKLPDHTRATATGRRKAQRSRECSSKAASVPGLPAETTARSQAVSISPSQSALAVSSRPGTPSVSRLSPRAWAAFRLVVAADVLGTTGTNVAAPAIVGQLHASEAVTLARRELHARHGLGPHHGRPAWRPVPLPPAVPRRTRPPGSPGSPGSRVLLGRRGRGSDRHLPRRRTDRAGRLRRAARPAGRRPADARGAARRCASCSACSGGSPPRR